MIADTTCNSHGSLVHFCASDKHVQSALEDYVYHTSTSCSCKKPYFDLLASDLSLKCADDVMHVIMYNHAASARTCARTEHAHFRRRQKSVFEQVANFRANFRQERGRDRGMTAVGVKGYSSDYLCCRLREEGIDEEMVEKLEGTPIIIITFALSIDELSTC